MLHYNSLLRESAFSNMIFEHINAGSAYVNFATRQYALSSKMHQLIGMNNDCLLPDLNSFISKVVHPEDWGVLLQFIKNDLKLRNNRCEVKIIHANGCYNWYEVVRQINADDKGATTELWLSFTNIDLLKKLQQRCGRLISNAGIAEDIMGIGFWEFDINSGEQYWSAAVYEIFELEYSQELSYSQMLECLDTTDKEKILNAFESMMALKIATDLELLLTNLKNERLWVRLIARPQINKQGSVVKIHGILQNINDEKMFAVAYEKLSDQLLMHKENLKEITHLVSNHLMAHISHLTMITSMVGAEHESQPQPAWMKHIKKVATQLHTTVNNLSNHLNIEFKNNDGKKQLFFKDVFDNAARSLSVNINDAYKLVDVDFSNCQSINYEPKHLENVMLSLMKNALEYKQPGKKPVLFVKTFVQDNQYCMQIFDNGLGIDLAAQGNQQIRPLHFDNKYSEVFNAQKAASTQFLNDEGAINKGNIFTVKF